MAKLHLVCAICGAKDNLTKIEIRLTVGSEFLFYSRFGCERCTNRIVQMIGG